MSLSLRANLPVDDTDSHFLYSAGDWQEQTGSSRQHNSNVHITSNYGATISFRYSGQAFVLFGTTPTGSNNVIVDISIDGGSPTTVTEACKSDAQYQVAFFQSPVVDFAVHTVLITNRGRSTDASFLFDNVVLYSNDIVPSMTSPPTLTTPASTTSTQSPSQSVSTQDSSSTQRLQASTSHTTSLTTTTSVSVSSSLQTSTQTALVLNSSTSTETFTSTDSQGSTVVFTQTFTTSFLASSQTQTGTVAAIAKPSHIGTVMAGVFGGLAFLLLIVVVVLVMRRRRKNSRAPLEEDERGLALRKTRSGKPSVLPQPFRLNAPRNPTNPDTSPTSGQSALMSEKQGYRTNAHRDYSPEPESSTAGPSSGDHASHAPLTLGFSSAAQPESATNILSHRRSTSVVNATDREPGARPHSPTMSSMYMTSMSGETYDAPPAYQPPLTGVRTSEFKTRSQLYNDHTSHPPGEGEQ